LVKAPLAKRWGESFKWALTRFNTQARDMPPPSPDVITANDILTGRVKVRNVDSMKVNGRIWKCGKQSPALFCEYNQLRDSKNNIRRNKHLNAFGRCSEFLIIQQKDPDRQLLFVVIVPLTKMVDSTTNQHVPAMKKDEGLFNRGPVRSKYRKQLRVITADQLRFMVKPMDHPTDPKLQSVVRCISAESPW
jgi:hypothetical protein